MIFGFVRYQRDFNAMFQYFARRQFFKMQEIQNLNRQPNTNLFHLFRFKVTNNFAIENWIPIFIRNTFF